MTPTALAAYVVTKGLSRMTRSTHLSLYNRYGRMHGDDMDSRIVSMFLNTANSAERLDLFNRMSVSLVPSVFNGYANNTDEMLAPPGVIPADLVAAAYKRRERNDLYALITHFDRLPATYQKKLVTSRNQNVARAIIGSHLVTALNDEDLLRYAYSRSMRVRMHLATAPVPNRYKIITLTARNADGTPIHESNIPVPDMVMTFIRSLTLQEIQALAATASPSVALVLYNKVRTLPAFLTAVTSVVEMVELYTSAPRTSLRHRRSAHTVRSLIRALLAVHDDLQPIIEPSNQQSFDEISAILSAAIATEFTPTRNTAYTRPWPLTELTPAQAKTIARAVTHIRATPHPVSTTIDLSTAPFTELLDWLEKTQGLPHAQSQALFARCRDDLGLPDVVSVFDKLSTSHQVALMAEMLTVDAVLWDPQIAVECTLKEASRGVTISQMFLFPPAQVAEVLRDTSLTVSEVMRLADSNPTMSVHQLYALAISPGSPRP